MVQQAAAIRFNCFIAEHVITLNAQINARTTTILILLGVASHVDGEHL
jgi:hypothetical protein